jgi:DNA-binding transcriptional LysR family regulator
MRVDPTSLELFICVVEEGTIAAAAERRHIAAAAVSKRMSELEAALRTQLLKRTNKGVEPTAAGNALLNIARRALHELDDVSVQMRDYASGTRGLVRLFANISAITQFLPRELKAFVDAHPHVEVHLEERISTFIARAVAENAADIGIVSLLPPELTLETFPYRFDHLSLITPRDHPLARRRSVSFAETLQFDYLGLHAGSSINLQLAKAAAELARPLRLRIQLTGYDALCSMVEAGLGVALLPETIAKRNARTASIHVVRLDEPWAQRELRICVRSYAALSVAARLLVDHLRRESSVP